MKWNDKNKFLYHLHNRLFEILTFIEKKQFNGKETEHQHVELSLEIIMKLIDASLASISSSEMKNKKINMEFMLKQIEEGVIIMREHRL